jgi:hypothetical protein
MFYMVFKCFCKCFRCMFQVLHLSLDYVTSASGCFKSRLGVAFRSLLTFDCLASVSPPSLGAGWASELEAQADVAPTLSS